MGEIGTADQPIFSSTNVGLWGDVLKQKKGNKARRKQGWVKNEVTAQVPRYTIKYGSGQPTNDLPPVRLVGPPSPQPEVDRFRK